MPYNRQRLERYAMLAEVRSQEQPPLSGGIDVDALSTELGLSREDGREIAMQMQESEWAKLDFRGDKPRMKLTIKGFEEILKLKRPVWRRWMDRNWVAVSGIAGAVAGAIFSGVFLLAAKLLEWILR